MRQLILGLISLVVCTALWAQDSVEAPDPPAIPTAAERAAAEQAAKQQGIQQGENEEDAGGVARTKKTVEGNTTITEYSRAGHVYSFKVKQDHGPTQYLDAEPDGRMEPADQNLYDDVNIPKWRIGNW